MEVRGEPEEPECGERMIFRVVTYLAVEGRRAMLVSNKTNKVVASNMEEDDATRLAALLGDVEWVLEHFNDESVGASMRRGEMMELFANIKEW